MSSSSALPDIFDPKTTQILLDRINRLTPETQASWGKMSVDQMLAHCCTPYEQALGLRQDGPSFLMKWLLRTFFKKSMTNEVPYKQNLPTAPAFVVADQRDFDREKERLSTFIRQTQELGRAHFEGKKQITLGALNATEWNNLLYKHLDHHLRQFGV